MLAYKYTDWLCISQSFRPASYASPSKPRVLGDPEQETLDLQLSHLTTKEWQISLGANRHLES